LLGGPATFCAS